MELTIPLVALSGLYLINNQSKKKTTNKRENFGNKNEGILPNTDIPNRNYPDDNSVVISDYDITSSLSVNNKFDSPSVYTDKYFNPFVNPEVFNPQAPMNMTGTPKFNSLSGEQVDANYFQHNNMVPFFGSSVRGRQTDFNSNEGVLDNMNGSGSNYLAKKEQSPLFKPETHLQWAHGAPNASDFMQSRVNVGMRMANVKPFAEERVGPGLGLGYTTEGSGGYNSGLFARDLYSEKNVDELRVANKPKSSGHLLYGHEGPAYSRVTNLGDIGHVEKNRVDTTFEMGQDRLFTTTGAEKGQTMRSIPVERYVSRPETCTDYSGVAAHQQAGGIYVPGEYMPSHNIQLGEVPFGVANANGRQIATEADYGIKSHSAYPNNRSSNDQGDYYGIMGGAVGAVVAPLLDILRPSRRENTIGTLRPYQNAKSTVSNSYIFNPADRPSATMRETTENSKFHLNVNSQQRGAYQVTDHTMPATIKQQTSDFFYAGNAGAGAGTRETRSYEAEYNQRNNDIKSATIDNRLVKGNMNLFNSSINMHTKAKEIDTINNRAVAPTMPYQSPDVANFGTLQGMGNNLYSNIQLDRTNPDVLDALKSNPYALSITGAF